MALLWTEVCRICFTVIEDALFFWSVDSATEIKGPHTAMAGSVETVVVPDRQMQPRAWLFFRRASVY
jgi:hypothetical protein